MPLHGKIVHGSQAVRLIPDLTWRSSSDIYIYNRAQPFRTDFLGAGWQHPNYVIRKDFHSGVVDSLAIHLQF